MLKIIWALDPFEKKEISDSVIGCAKAFEKITTSIEPVYVLSPSEISLHMLESESQLAQYEPAAKKAILSITQKAKIKGLIPATILTDYKSSLSGAVDSLKQHAQQRNADLILVSTHAKTGVARFFAGSFTETLITHANTSVLCVNPKTKHSPVKRIIFATDLSTRSIGIYPLLLKWALVLKAEVILYHCIPTPLEPVLQSGVYLMGGGWVPFGDYIKTESKERKKALNQMVEQARELGVKAKSLLEQKKSSIVDALLKSSIREKTDCIALAIESGPIEATLLGSISRQIVRSSSKPVLLLKNKE